MAENKRTPSGGYAQNWPAYNAAQINEKRLFLILLHELCAGVENAEQITGRPRLSLGDMIFSAAYKVYSTFCMKRFSTDLIEAHAKGYIRRVPKPSSVFHYLQLDSLTPVLSRLIELTSLPLEPFETQVAVDSTGLSTCQYARWLDERQMVEHSKREWIKLHIVCGVKTNTVMSVVVTSRRESDCRQFGRLVAAASRNFRLVEVSADKAYCSGENMRHALLAGAAPYLAFKSDHRLGTEYKSTIWNRMLAMMLYRRAEFMEHYNKRNNVEATFHMIKSKFGDRVRSKSSRSKINEALCKVLCHNICVLIQSIYELGIDPTFLPLPIRLQQEEPPASGIALTVAESGTVRNRIAAATRKMPPQKTEGALVRGAKKIKRNNENQMALFK